MIRFRFTFFLTVISFSFWLSGCSNDDNDVLPELQLEYIVSSEPVAQVSADEIRARYPAASALVSTGVTAYKIVYKTSIGNQQLNASGLIILPDNLRNSLTMLSFQHGTITEQEEAPSAYQPLGNMEAYLGGTLGASLAKGYMVVMPDYIGYGESSNVQHPYQEKASLASACLDMLRAAKELAELNGLSIRKEVRLLGYSEGGYATLALHQAIQETASDAFTVEASYPGAGAYDMVGTAQWVVDQTSALPPLATSFYMWTMVTYNTLYGLNTPINDMLQSPYAENVQAALDAGNPMAAQVSDNPAELFAPDFIAGIKNGTNMPFLAALQANNVYDWRPNAPVILYHAEGDDIVPVLNATTAWETMTALGAQVQFVSLGDIGHREAASAYIEAVLPQLLQ